MYFSIQGIISYKLALIMLDALNNCIYYLISLTRQNWIHWNMIEIFFLNAIIYCSLLSLITSFIFAVFFEYFVKSFKLSSVIRKQHILTKMIIFVTTNIRNVQNWKLYFLYNEV